MIVIIAASTRKHPMIKRTNSTIRIITVLLSVSPVMKLTKSCGILPIVKIQDSAWDVAIMNITAEEVRAPL